MSAFDIATNNICLFINGVEIGNANLFVKTFPAPQNNISLFIHGSLALGTSFKKNNIPFFIFNDGNPNSEIFNTNIYVSVTSGDIFNVSDSSTNNCFVKIKSDNVQDNIQLFLKAKIENTLNNSTSLFINGLGTMLPNGFILFTKTESCFVRILDGNTKDIPLFIKGQSNIFKDISLSIQGGLSINNSKSLFIKGIISVEQNNIVLFINGTGKINNNIFISMSGF